MEKKVPKSLKYIRPRSNRKQVSRIKKNGILKIKENQPISLPKEAKFLGMHMAIIAPFKILTTEEIKKVDSKLAERLDLRAKYELYALGFKMKSNGSNLLQKICPEFGGFSRKEEDTIKNVNTLLLKVGDSFNKAQKFVFEDNDWIEQIKKIPDFFEENPEDYYEMYYPKYFINLNTNVHALAAEWIYSEIFINWDVSTMKKKEAASHFKSLKKLLEANSTLAGLKGIVVCAAMKLLRHLVQAQIDRVKWPKSKDLNKVSELKQKYKGLKYDHLLKKKFSPRELAHIGLIASPELLNEIAENLDMGVSDEILTHNVLLETSGKYRCLLDAVNHRREERVTIETMMDMMDEVITKTKNVGNYRELKKKVKHLKGNERTLQFQKLYREERYKVQLKRSPFIIESMILQTYGKLEDYHDTIIGSLKPETLEPFLLGNFHKSSKYAKLLIKKLENDLEKNDRRKDRFIRSAFLALGNHSLRHKKQNLLMRVFLRMKHKEALIKKLFYTLRGPGVSDLLSSNSKVFFLVEIEGKYELRHADISLKIPSGCLLMRFYRNIPFIEACIKHSGDTVITSALKLMNSGFNIFKSRSSSKLQQKMEDVDYLIENYTKLQGNMSTAPYSAKNVLRFSTSVGSDSCKGIFPYTSLAGYFDVAQKSGKGHIPFKPKLPQKMDSIIKKLENFEFCGEKYGYPTSGNGSFELIDLGKEKITYIFKSSKRKLNVRRTVKLIANKRNFKIFLKLMIEHFKSQLPYQYIKYSSEEIANNCIYTRKYIEGVLGSFLGRGSRGPRYIAKSISEEFKAKVKAKRLEDEYGNYEGWFKVLGGDNLKTFDVDQRENILKVRKFLSNKYRCDTVAIYKAKLVYFRNDIFEIMDQKEKGIKDRNKEYEGDVVITNMIFSGKKLRFEYLNKFEKCHKAVNLLSTADKQIKEYLEQPKKENVYCRNSVNNADWIYKDFRILLKKGAGIKDLMRLARSHGGFGEQTEFKDACLRSIIHVLAKEDYEDIEKILKNFDGYDSSAVLKLLTCIRYHKKDEGIVNNLVNFYIDTVKRVTGFVPRGNKLGWRRWDNINTPCINRVENIFKLRKHFDNLLKKMKDDVVKKKLKTQLEELDSQLVFKDRIFKSGVKCRDLLLEYALSLKEKDLEDKDFKVLHNSLSQLESRGWRRRGMLPYQNKQFRFFYSLANVELHKRMISFIKKITPLIKTGAWERELGDGGEEEETPQVKFTKKISKILADKIDIGERCNNLIFNILGNPQINIAVKGEIVRYLRFATNEKSDIKLEIFNLLNGHFAGEEVPSEWHSYPPTLESDHEIEDFISFSELTKKAEKPDKKEIEYFIKLGKIGFGMKVPEIGSKFDMVTFTIKKLSDNIAFRAICYYLSSTNPDDHETNRSLSEILLNIIRFKREKLLFKVFDFLTKQVKGSSLDLGSFSDYLKSGFHAEQEMDPSGQKVPLISILAMHMPTTFKRFSALFQPIRDEMGDLDEELQMIEDTTKYTEKYKLFSSYGNIDAFNDYKFYKLGKKKFDREIEFEKKKHNFDVEFRKFFKDDEATFDLVNNNLSHRDYIMCKMNLTKLVPIFARLQNSDDKDTILETFFLGFNFNEIYSIYRNGYKNFKKISKTCFAQIADLLENRGWLEHEDYPQLKYSYFMGLLLLMKYYPKHKKMDELLDKGKDCVKKMTVEELIHLSSLLLNVNENFEDKEIQKKLLKKIQKRLVLKLTDEFRRHYTKEKYHFYELSNFTANELIRNFKMEKYFEDDDNMLISVIELQDKIFKKIAKDKELVCDFMKDYKLKKVFKLRNLAERDIKIDEDVTREMLKIAKKKKRDVEDTILRKKHYIMKKFFDYYLDAQGAFNNYVHNITGRHQSKDFVKVVIKEDLKYMKLLEEKPEIKDKLESQGTLVLTMPNYNTLLGVNGFIEFDFKNTKRNKVKIPESKRPKLKKFLKAIAEKTNNLLIPSINIREIKALVIHEIMEQLKYHKLIMKENKKRKEIFEIKYNEEDSTLYTKFTIAKYKARLEKADKREIVKRCIEAVAKKTFISNTENNNDSVIRRLKKISEIYSAKLPKNLNDMLFALKNSTLDLKEAKKLMEDTLEKLGKNPDKMDLDFKTYNPDLEKTKADICFLLRQSDFRKLKINDYMTEYKFSYPENQKKFISKTDKNIEVFLKTKDYGDHLEKLAREKIGKLKMLGDEKPKIGLVFSKKVDWIPLKESEIIVDMVFERFKAFYYQIHKLTKWMVEYKKFGDDEIKGPKNAMKKLMKLRFKVQIDKVGKERWCYSVKAEKSLNDLEEIMIEDEKEEKD